MRRALLRSGSTTVTPTARAVGWAVSLLAPLAVAACGLGADTDIDLFAPDSGVPDGAPVGSSDASDDVADSSDATQGSPDGSAPICASLACEGDTPYCDPATGTCVECISHAHCEGERPYCSGLKTCVECVAEGHCEQGEHPHCLVAEGRCVECVSSLQCSSGICDGEYECSQ